MEHIELHKKYKGLILYDKMEKIPVRDHLYMAYDQNFNRTLYQKGKFAIYTISHLLLLFQRK